MSRSPIWSLVFIVVLLLAGRADAQWQIISKPSNERLGVINFRNEFNGFIGYRVSGGQVIAKTTDAGKTWYSVQLEFSRYTGDVSDIFMVDELDGWATCDGTDAALANRGLYRTSDGGMSWQSVQLVKDASSVIQIGQSVYVTSRRTTPSGIPITISRDAGNSWNPSTPMYMNDVTFVDPQRGVACRYEPASTDLGNWYRTTDAGNTWIAIPNMDESWSVYGEWGTPNFYAVPEDESLAQLNVSGSKVLRSTNYGQTWATISNFNFNSTGHLAVANGNFYFQVSDRHPANLARASGIYLSIDRGITWRPVGGPSSDPDTRFDATGCKGGIVYASDSLGNLWKTRNGGDGTIVEPPFTLEFGADTIRIASLVCETKSARFNFRNLYCSPDSIVSITLDASDATSSGAVSLSNVPALPKVYNTDEGDQFDVNWDPSKLLTGDSTIYVRVRLRYYSTATNTLIDTSIVIEAIGQGAPPTAAYPAQVDMGSTSSCLPIDSLFTITNTGCDTLYLDAPTIPANAGITLQDKLRQPINFPLVLAPGDVDTIYLVLMRTQLGPFNLNLDFPASHQSIEGSFRVSIQGTVVQTGPQFAVAFDSLINALFDSVLLDRGKMTRCDPPQEFYLYIRNPGCTGVALRNVMFEGDGSVFTVTPAGSLPDTLSGEDLHRITVTITPRILGINTERLRIRYKIGDDPSIDLYYPFTVDVGYGTRLLSLDESLRDLDTVEYCQTRDSVIRFQNTGCDTLTLTDAMLNGADYHLDPNGTLPRKIAPGAYDSVVVQYDPLLPGDAAGQVQFISDADTLATRAVDLVSFALPTDTVTFRLVPEREIVNDNDTLNFNLFPDTTIRGKGMRSLSVILSYNGDVMAFMSATPRVPGLTILPVTELEAGLKARQISLTLLHANEITLDSLVSLVSLRFRTTLSDSTHATMNLANFIVNNGDPKFAKCILGSRAEESKLTLTLYCGDSLIKKTLLLNKLVLSTKPAWPNPSSRVRSTAIKLPYVLNAPMTLSLRVYSMEGVLAYEAEEARGVGESELAVPLERLSSGVYHYTMSVEGTQVRGQFIVE